MSALDVAVRLVYIAAAACFVWGLHLMNSPATARKGNLLSVAGMLAAVLATVAALFGRSVSRRRAGSCSSPEPRSAVWSA